MSMSVGLGIGNTAAKAATVKTKIIQTIASQNSVPSRRVSRPGATATSSPIVSSSVAMANPGIEHGVEHVDDEIHQHKTRGDQQHHTLQNDEVAVVDRPNQ